MPTAKNRELISVSTQAHRHLKAVVKAFKAKGVPINGTLLASEHILAIPLPNGNNGHAKPAPKAEPVAVSEEGEQ